MTIRHPKLRALTHFVLFLAGPFLLASLRGQIVSPTEQLEVNGTPTYTLYEPESLSSNNRVNDIAIDGLGRLVVASASDLIVFDGNGWLSYHVSDPALDDKLVIYTVVLGNDGKLYCSSNKGIHSVSFVADWKFELTEIPNARIAQDTRTYSYRESFANDRYLYFYGQSDIARLDTLTQRFERLTRATGMTLGSAAVHDQRLYAFGVDGVILLHIEKDEWIEIEGQTDRDFKEGIRTASNWPGKALLAGPDSSGIFRLEDNTLKPWQTEINKLESQRVLAIEPISHALIAASVDTKGIYLLNDQGQIVELLSRDLDYRLGKIRKLIHAGNGTIWGAGEHNIVRIDFNRPLSDFAIMMPYSVTFPRVFWYKGVLHIITDKKIVRAETFDGGAIYGYKWLGSQIENVYNALPVEEGILVASKSGIFLLKDDDTADLLLNTTQTTLLIRHPAHPELVVAAGVEKYFLLKRIGDTWTPTDISAPSPGTSFFGAAAPNGGIWIEHGIGQASLVTLSPTSLAIRTFHLGENFTTNWVNIWNYNNRILFTGGKKSYFVEWNEQSQSFEAIPDKHINNIIGKFSGIARPASDSFGNIWVPANAIHPILRLQEDGSYKVDTQPLASIQNDNLMHAIPGQNGVMWLVGEKSIYRYDPRKKRPNKALPPTRIFQLELVKNHELSYTSDPSQADSPPQIEYANNNIRIHFTTPTIKVKENLWHEYRVDGYINDWTVTQTPHSVEFDNLHEGLYRVQIRAVTDRGRYGEEALAQFIVLPPAYRTRTALVLYLLAALLLVAAITIGTRKISEEKNDKLQRLVDLRTRELGMANDELQHLVSRAESATAAKSVFLENISHELRTPLNQIVGPIALLLEDTNNPGEKETLSIIHRAADRMLKMVEKLTSFTENASKTLPLESIPFDLYALVEDLHESFRPEAEQRQLDFTKHIDPKLGHYWSGDVNRLRRALNIILENAFKFTPQGSIGIDVSLASETTKLRRIKFEISDTGIGINAKMLDKIFEPFSQLASATKAKSEGTGIGLALCRQTVAALNGEIEVESIEGLGTVFRVTVPLSPNLFSEKSPPSPSASFSI